MLLRIPRVLERSLLRFQQRRRTRSSVPGRVLFFVHAGADGRAIAETDVRGVRLPVHPFDPLAAEVAVIFRLALRVELAAHRQVVLADNLLRPLVRRGRPGVALLRTPVQGSEAAPVAALAGVADVLPALGEVGDALLLVGCGRRDRVERLRRGGRSPTVEDGVRHVGGRGHHVLPVMARLRG